MSKAWLQSPMRGAIRDRVMPSTPSRSVARSPGQCGRAPWLGDLARNCTPSIGYCNMINICKYRDPGGQTTILGIPPLVTDSTSHNPGDYPGDYSPPTHFITIYSPGEISTLSISTDSTCTHITL